MGRQEEENKQIAVEFLDALCRADVEKVRRLYADDFRLWTAGSLPFSGTKTKAQALEGMKGVLSLFPKGLKFQIDAITAEGERLAIEARSDGYSAAGHRYQQDYHFLMRVRDGKILEFKEYMDTEKARAVLVDGRPG